jgi:hypothetical protein
VRALRSLVLITLLLASLLFVIGAGWWLYVGSTLPVQVESELDLRTLLKQSIESDRQSAQLNKRPAEREKVDWPTPDFSRLPKNLVALYIMSWQCPTYFQTPREEGWPWTKRLLNAARSVALPGDGACEFAFAQRLAMRIGVSGTGSTAVMADRIHRFLKKDQLVAYDLHSMQFAQALTGVEAASRYLLQKELVELSLAELAELQLAIPPWDQINEVYECSAVGLLRQARNRLLLDLGNAGLAAEDAVKSAMAQPLRCSAVKR